MTDLPEQLMSGPPQRPARQRSTAWIVVLVAAALTVLAVAITQDWFGGAASPTATPAISASPQAGASAGPSPSGTGRPSIGSGVGVDWATVATFPGASANDVTAHGQGWVAVGAAGAVGCDACPGLETYAGKIWTSADGRTWDDVAVAGLEGSQLYAVASGPAGLVAVGLQAVEGGGQPRTLVLVSVDGETWTGVTGTPFEAPGASVSDVVGGPIYVAAGVVGEPEQDGRPTFWISPDGQDWQEVYRSTDGGWIGEIVHGTNLWVAVGAVYRPTGGGERSSIPFPAVWDSPDGREWTQRDLPLPADAGGGLAQAVLNAGPGLVAVGYAEYAPLEPPGPVLGFAGWRSTDGVTWEAAPVTPDFLEDIGGGHLLYETTDRVFAIGSGCRCGTGWPGRWWTTPDGLAWTEHQETPPILYSVIPFGGGLLGVGIENGEGAIFISE